MKANSESVAMGATHTTHPSVKPGLAVSETHPSATRSTSRAKAIQEAHNRLLHAPHEPRMVPPGESPVCCAHTSAGSPLESLVDRLATRARCAARRIDAWWRQWSVSIFARPQKVDALAPARPGYASSHAGAVSQSGAVAQPEVGSLLPKSYSEANATTKGLKP